MNICIITYGYPTPNNQGLFVFVDQLVSAWADMGYKMTVINPIPYFVEYFDKKRYYKRIWEKRTLKGNCIKVVSPRYFRVSNKKVGFVDTQRISYKSFQRTVEQTIKELDEKPDILYSHFLPAGCHVGDIGKQMATPAFCAFGESSLWSIDGWDLNNVRESLSKLSGIVSVSTENKRVLVENHLYSEDDIEVFPNGVDHSIFYPRDKRETRRRLGFPEDAFIGAFTGSFSDAKGVLRAQEAANNAGNMQMIYIGGGASRPKSSNILFCGKLPHEEIPEYLSAADFFILPTRAEGCCNAIIEAMACGLPIISSDGPYNDDILNETYSIRTKPDDVEAMSKAIRFLSDHPKERMQMSEYAKTASLEFDIYDRAARIISFMQRKNEAKKHI